MSNVLGVIAAIVMLGGLLMMAERFDYWPGIACSSAAPWGPHDYRCKLFAGR